MRLPLKSPSGVGVSETACMLILYLSAQMSYIWLFLPAPSASFLFTFRFQITLSHPHPFPFWLLLLIVFLLKQRSHFNVNSIYAYLPLNPLLSFRTDFLQIPEKLMRKTCICLWGPLRTMCPSLPHKRQCILLYVEHRFPILYCVCALHSHMVLHLWCMTGLAILPLLCSTVQLTTVSKSHGCDNGDHYTFFFQCCCLSVFFSMPPWNLSLSCRVRV